MKKKTILTRAFVLTMALTLIMAGCDGLFNSTGNSDPTSPTAPTTPTEPTTPTNPTEPTNPTTPTDPILPVPGTAKAVLGYGYDITSKYASSPDIKFAVLDLDKLLEAKKVKEDFNLRYGEFETVSGKNINEYTRNITAKVSYSANAKFLKVASFSAEVGASFGSDLIKKGEYAFTTRTSRIVTGAYNITNNGLDAYLTQDFSNDIGTLTPQQLINKYGTHVMLGAVLGAKADYHLSVRKKEENNITNLEAYAKAKAEATYMGFTAGASSEAEIKAKFSQYFYTDETYTSTKVVGGKVQYGQFINDMKNYDKWIESIDGNSLWIDYYPNSLIPLSDFVKDKSRSDAIAQAIENYCNGKEIVVAPFVPRDSNKGSIFIPYSENVVKEKATNIKGDNDLYSDKDRTIAWNLKVQLSLVDLDASVGKYRTLKADYTYTVKENVTDFTELQIKTSRTYQLDGYASKLTGKTFEERTGTIKGKEWDYVSGGSYSTGIMQQIYVKIDGKNDDDRGEIGFKASLNVEYEE